MFFKKKVKAEAVSSEKMELKNEAMNEVILPVHLDSVDFSSQEERSNFTNTIGDNFISRRQLDLSDEELEAMSVIDASEMIRLEQWAMRNLMKASPELEEKLHNRMDKIFSQIAKKILTLDEIYVIYSKATGCPYLFSHTYKSEEGYVTTPPNIKVYTKANASIFAKNLENDNEVELREIKNNEEKSDIHDFFGECFYMDGACGIEVDSEFCVIDKSALVAPPDFSNVSEASRPVMNPDVVRWNLLMAQLGAPDTEEKNIIFGCYYNQLGKSLLNAKFLMPMKAGENFPKPEGNAESVKLEKEASFGLVTMPGKEGKTAIQLYTDWKRLYGNLGREEKWNGMVTTIDGIISVFDCAINADKTYHACGFYLSQDMFEKMKGAK